MRPVPKPARCLIFLLCVVSGASGQVTIDWVTVGSPGNAADPATGFGSIDSEYRIGVTEITNEQYAQFLNAVAMSDPFGLYNEEMGSNPRGGIIRLGADGRYSYSVKPQMGTKPVIFVSWFDAARMANWMSNGQGAGDTESGVYLLDHQPDGWALQGIFRDTIANAVFLPTENEWYKAAYYEPPADGGDTDYYWLYATQSNDLPAVASATNTGDVASPGPNVVNYGLGADWNAQNGNVTTVGSAGSTSFYGAFDMNGNVWEWTESGGVTRYLRGGSWNSGVPSSTYRMSFDPTAERFSFGFRLASRSPCPPDLAAPFGTLNIFDIIEFIALYNAQDPAADLAAPAGSFNIFDVQAYLGLYNAGCP